VSLALANLALSAAMAGLVWFVQVVHYPLFAGVGPTGWAAYHAAHTRRTTWVVAPLMLAEHAAALALLAAPPPGVSRAMAGVGYGLLLVAWVSTFAVQVPLHNRLGGDGLADAAEGMARLTRTNWIRTVAWTLRVGVALATCHAAAAAARVAG